jgi:hypothetical protein
MKKLLLSTFITLFVITSCKKDNTEVIVPASVVSYQITDSMRLSAATMTNFPTIYNNYNGKTYLRQTSKAKASYKMEGSDIIITFEDSSVLNSESALALKFVNKSPGSVAGNYPASSNEIFYKSYQATSSSSWVTSIVWDKAISGNIQISYDASTKTLNGTITDLKYFFGVYVPYFLPGSPVTPSLTDIGFLTAEGSFRKHTIQFQFVKAL